MTSGQIHRLERISYTDLIPLIALRPIVLLPWGSAEAHGPHLPLGTDGIISREVTRRAAVRLANEDGCCVIIAPSVDYGVTNFGAAFPGTLSVSDSTVSSLVDEICRSLGKHGLSRTCIVNNHLEPAHIAALKLGASRAAASGCVVWVPDNTERRWATTLGDEFRSGACHAGRYETSLVLAAEPHTDVLTRAARLSPNPASLSRAIRLGARTFEEAQGPDAYFGWPADATVEEGDALYSALVEMVVQTIRESGISTPDFSRV
ncbi:MAG: creatininase family protein [Myxococcales bacterium]|nr:creatininase family protein [Myxococcales bacterium]